MCMHPTPSANMTSFSAAPCSRTVGANTAWSFILDPLLLSHSSTSGNLSKFTSLGVRRQNRPWYHSLTMLVRVQHGRTMIQPYGLHIVVPWQTNHGSTLHGSTMGQLCFMYHSITVVVPCIALWRVSNRVTDRSIFVTKTKIKTKIISFRFIKTRIKTISFQKTKTK